MEDYVNFIMINSSVVADRSITATDCLVLMQMIVLKNKYRLKSPDFLSITESELAKIMDVSIDTIKRSIKRLEKSKYLKVNRNKVKGINVTNTYEITAKAIPKTKKKTVERKIDSQKLLEFQNKPENVLARKKWIEEHTVKTTEKCPDWYENGDDIAEWFGLNHRVS